MSRTRVVHAVAAALLTLCGCNAGGTTDVPPGRTFQGGVQIVLEGGTRRVRLAIDADAPRVRADGDLSLEVNGTAEGRSYAITITLGSAIEGRRYQFPDSTVKPAASMTVDGQPLTIGTIGGFLEVESFDSETQLAAVVCSLVLSGVNGFAVAELDLVFAADARR